MADLSVVVACPLLPAPIAVLGTSLPPAAPAYTGHTVKQGKLSAWRCRWLRPRSWVVAGTLTIIDGTPMCNRIVSATTLGSNNSDYSVFCAALLGPWQQLQRLTCRELVGTKRLSGQNDNILTTQPRRPYQSACRLEVPVDQPTVVMQVLEPHAQLPGQGPDQRHQQVLADRECLEDGDLSKGSPKDLQSHTSTSWLPEGTGDQQAMRGTLAPAGSDAGAGQGRWRPFKWHIWPGSQDMRFSMPQNNGVTAEGRQSWACIAGSCLSAAMQLLKALRVAMHLCSSFLALQVALSLSAAMVKQ